MGGCKKERKIKRQQKKRWFSYLTQSMLAMFRSLFSALGVLHSLSSSSFTLFSSSFRINDTIISPNHRHQNVLSSQPPPKMINLESLPGRTAHITIQSSPPIISIKSKKLPGRTALFVLLLLLAPVVPTSPRSVPGQEEY